MSDDLAVPRLGTLTVYFEGIGFDFADVPETYCDEVHVLCRERGAGGFWITDGTGKRLRIDPHRGAPPISWVPHP